MLARSLLRSTRLAGKPSSLRSISTTPSLLASSKEGGQSVPNLEYAKQQTSKPINPSLDSHTSTNHPDRLPKAGAKNAPPEFLSSVDPKWAKRVGGSHLKPDKDHEQIFELKIDPVNRDGEKVENMRARLLYQSRKRGILETDLLLSTFAKQNLPSLSEKQLKEYDKFLDEADWDIYYWCTQEAPPTSAEYAEGAAPDAATVVSAGRTPKESNYGAEEWAQTVGKAKVPYKEIPPKWKNSEILEMLRAHVEARKGESGGGLGRMPSL